MYPAIYNGLLRPSQRESMIIAAKEKKVQMWQTDRKLPVKKSES